MGSISEFGKSQDAHKLVDALNHLMERLNPPCRLSTQFAPPLCFPFKSESSSFALALRDFKATPILPSPLFFISRYNLSILRPPHPDHQSHPYDEAHASH
ncbi:hypothetical protein N7447_003626 [Penicillium robsamsonii]|uniref:uncharacterized protein n=1 Tax=Penicillium robsamsonii TaxID=1792511 RepID=UPI0025488CA4|nr:uncharacterized protein N7447_003626 [Penicillium robsamsonii]KAJ5826863.1 hypothetical protein N7447_003626 [Penicillium robsamsonii]